MFGKKKRLAHELSEANGVVAWATVIAATTRWTSGTNYENGPYTVGSNKHMTVELRIEPEDEPAFEAKLRQTFPGRSPMQGFQAKVIYDPADHSRIVVLEDHIFPPGISHEQAERAAAHRKQVREATESGRLTEFLQEDIRARTAAAATGAATGPTVIVNGASLDLKPGGQGGSEDRDSRTG